ncbi:hypothetical protein JXA34_01605 [Patescibacteria group bacterium]|nr:hypothetical protein [Patescibacteria group bacterium]
MQNKTAKFQKHLKYMHHAAQLCNNSKCGFKTGCIAVKDDKILIEGWNETLPGEIYCQNGVCIREKENLSGGKDIEKVCAIHAEASVVAQAASAGIPLKDCVIYVTLFPCIICSRLLSKVKIAELYYMNAYPGNNLGESFFKASNIPITQIKEKDIWEYDAKIKKTPNGKDKLKFV